MLRSLKERKRTMRSERKRTQCPTLVTDPDVYINFKYKKWTEGAGKMVKDNHAHQTQIYIIYIYYIYIYSIYKINIFFIISRLMK